MEKYKTTIEVTGGKEELNELLHLLAKIQYLGRIGSSDTIPVHVDGDGSGQLQFKTIDGEENLIDQFKLEKFKEEVKSEKIESHWIGE
ncbi:MAG: hypothetical protein AABY15_02815 [Nanoarchaeota archaeon]